METKKNFHRKEFKLLGRSIELITREPASGGDGFGPQRHIRFRERLGSTPVSNFVCGIIEEFFDSSSVNNREEEERRFRKTFTQILEKKFGMKIKTCGNCANLDGKGHCHITSPWADCHNAPFRDDTCESVQKNCGKTPFVDYWEPKGIKKMEND